ncbi:coenzyme F420-0:L-glutamate ligase [Candidatus Saccharibacteria bacterium]|nr:coenzyme F420-0:L-glutamate ligase [Candidatus Saccharibacteria bacterium]
MKITPIKTRPLIPPKDDLLAVIAESLKELPEQSVLAIASKVVAIDEGRCIPLSEIEHDDLVKRESDKYLPRSCVPGAHIIHTLKNNLLIGSAGIDESNANNYFILWPEDPKASAKQIFEYLKSEFGTKRFAVLITDSHSVAMRRGTVGISLASYGLKPLKDYRGKEDIFGRELKATMTNLADGLAAAATLVMGEGAEVCPLALIEDLDVEFISQPYRPTDPDGSFEIPPEQDMFKPFFDGVDWQE